MQLVSYTKLFEYAGLEYSVLWAECYKLFINSGILTYEGTTTFYFDDVKDAVSYNIVEVTESIKAMRIIYGFMVDECITRDIKIRHK